jgi:hypothetical protein
VGPPYLRGGVLLVVVVPLMLPAADEKERCMTEEKEGKEGGRKKVDGYKSK